MSLWKNFFRAEIAKAEPDIFAAIDEELRRIREEAEIMRCSILSFFEDHQLSEGDFALVQPSMCRASENRMIIATTPQRNILDVRPQSEVARVALLKTFSRCPEALHTQIKFDGWSPTPLPDDTLQKLDAGAKTLEEELWRIEQQPLGSFSTLIRRIIEKNATRSLVLFGQQCWTLDECERVRRVYGGPDTIQDTYNALANPVPLNTEPPQPLTL